ncbi:uncharacterized protein [Prorops nasuta]|uniref:uncharacterized protein n=1 Tax=Prorops nasuta TaxID=863751 RepID=UPI0034CFB8F2
MNTPYVHYIFILIEALLSFYPARINAADISAAQEDDYRLPTSIEPISYDISIEPNYPTSTTKSAEISTFHGTVIINAVAKQVTNYVILHAGSIELESVNVIKESNEIIINKYVHKKDTEKLTITFTKSLSPEENIFITIIYNGRLRDDMIGFYKSSYMDSKGNKNWLGLTQFQTTHARHAFPCFDEPRFKAKFTIHIAENPSYKCLSNMPLSKGPTEDDPWFHFHESVPMSSYLVAFVISKFESNGNDKIKVWARPEAIKQTNYALDIAAKSLKFFEDLFNINYKIPKLDMIAAPDFSAGAMENWGLITYRETRVLYDEEDSSIISKQSVASVIVHEITHMWLGNLVTPSWWGHLWLSEAFARYYQYMATGAIETYWSMDKQFVVEQLQVALGVDASETSKPMTRNPNSVEDVSKMGDSITYSKGASIVRMMNFIFGQKNFLEALKNYLTAKSNDVATPDDLWQSFQKIVDESNVKLDDPVKMIMETWTNQPGYPVIYVSTDETGLVTLQQKRFFIRNLNNMPSEMKWHVPLTWTTSKKDQQPNFKSVETKLWLKKDSETTNIKIDSNEWIIFNIQQSGFYRVRYDRDLWYRIFTVLNSKEFEQIHELNRAAIVDDLLNLARAGLLDYTIALDGLKYIEQETNYLPIKSAINGLRYLQRRFAGQPFESLLNKFVLNLFKNTYTKLRDADKQSDSHFLILLKHELNDLACKLNDVDCINNSKQRFSAWRNSHEKIDVNQRPAVYCAAIREGTVEDWEFLWEKAFQSNVAADQLVMLGALGCTKDKSLLKRYLDYALTSYEQSKIHQQDRLSLFATASSSSLTGAEYVLDYVDENKVKIIAFGGKDTISSILTNTAQYLSTKGLVNKFESLIEKYKVDFSPILSSLNDALTLAKYDLEWYEKNEGAIVNGINDYLRSYQLPSSILPDKYIIAVTPNIHGGYFYGVMEMSAEVAETTYEIVLHAEGMTYLPIDVMVDEIKETPSEIKEDKNYSFLIIRLKKRIEIGSKLHIIISYTGTLMNKDMRGFYRSSYNDNDKVKMYLAATHLEPVGARRLFPCLDEPKFKAIFQLKVTTLENQNALSNTPQDRTDNSIGDQRIITFQETPKMSTYLVAIVVSEFQCWSDKSNKFSVCARPDAENQAKYALSIMGSLIKVYQDQLDYEYKQPKLDMVALPDFSSGAMENWGLLTYKESKLLYDPKESAINVKQIVARTISHEISHQWFGNLVTPAWWSYIWLSEGFARYFEYFKTEYIDNGWVMESQFVVDQIHSAFSADASLSSRPMNYHVEKPKEIRSKFNTISYAKAASVIRMAEKLVGKEIFKKALKNYLKSRNYDVATPEHLYDEFNKLTKDDRLGYNFGDFMNSWASQAGYPVVHVSFAKNYKSAMLKQKRFLLKSDEKSSNDNVWYIPITWASKSRPTFEDVEVSDMMTETSKTINLGTTLPEDWVILNVQQNGFYRVNYDENHWQQIIKFLKSDAFEQIDEINRASLIDDLMNLARAGEVDYGIVLSATEYLVKETSYAPWHAFFNGAKYLQKRFAYQDTDDLFKKHINRIIEPIYNNLFPDNKFNDDEDDIYTKKLLKMEVFDWACELNMNKNCIVLALDHFYEWVFNDTPVPVNYRYVVYRTGLRKDDLDHWQRLGAMYANSTIASDKLVTLKAMGCFRDPSHLYQLLYAAISPNSNIRYQDSVGVFSSVYDCSLEGLIFTMNFIGNRYLEMLEYYEDESKFKNIINGISQRLSTSDLIARFEKMINIISKKKPILANSLRSYIEKASYELKWYKTNMPAIYEWLDITYQPSKVYRLPKVLSPVEYKIYIDAVDFEEKDKFNGEVTIGMDIRNTTYSIILNAAASLNILDVEVTLGRLDKTKPLKVLNYIQRKESEQLVIYISEILNLGEYVTANIKYVGLLSDPSKGFYRSSYTDKIGNVHWMASTQFSPIHARRAFPCFDEPEYKAEFTISIKRTKEYDTASNMPIIGHEILDGDSIIDIYSPSEKMSTYTVAFVVSKFKSVTIGKTNFGGEIRLVGRPDMFDYINSTSYYANNALISLEQFTKIHYGLPKLDLVAVPDLSFSAMENWGLATFREYALFTKDDTSAYNEQYKSNIISHELAHMWFGNLVTLHWWESTWLNEGFAEYFQWFISNEINPLDWQLLDQFVVNSLQPALLYDGMKTHSMTYPVETYSDITSVFDPIEYIKAASVIRMFHHAFGDKPFTKAIQNYLRAYGHITATPENFVEIFKIAVAESSEVQVWSDYVDEFMKSWTTQPGYPLVEASRDGYYLNITQKPYSYDSKGNVNAVYWIPITFTTESSPTFESTPAKYWLTKYDRRLWLDSGTGWYIVNVKQTGYYRVNYDAENWQRLINALKTRSFRIIDAVNRAQIIDDVLNLARTRHIDFKTAQEATVYLVQEDNYLPWRAFFNAITFFADRLENKDTRPIFAQYITDLISNLYNSIDFNIVSKEPHIKQLLAEDVSKWACKYSYKSCVSQALKLFSLWYHDRAIWIDPNFKPAVFCTAMEHASEEMWNFLWEEYKKENVASEKRTILKALACSKNENSLNFYLQQAIEGNTIPKMYINDVFKFVSEAHSNGLDVVLNFVTIHYHKIYDSTRTWDTVANIISNIASKISSKQQLNHLIDFLKQDNSDLPKEIQHSLEVSLETAKINFQWSTKYNSEFINTLDTTMRSMKNFKKVQTSGATIQLQHSSWIPFLSLILYILYCKLCIC